MDDGLTLEKQSPNISVKAKIINLNDLYRTLKCIMHTEFC